MNVTKIRQVETIRKRTRKIFNKARRKLFQPKMKKPQSAQNYTQLGQLSTMQYATWTMHFGTKTLQKYIFCNKIKFATNEKQKIHYFSDTLKFEDKKFPTYKYEKVI